MSNRDLLFNAKLCDINERLIVALLIIWLVAVNLSVVPSVSANNAPSSRSRLLLKTMSESNPKTLEFYPALKRELAVRGRRLKNLCHRRDKFQKRILEDYGAIFIAHNSIVTPPVCVFANAEAVEQFQASVEIARAEINGVEIELQAAAMRALLAARAEALAENLDVTPRGGAEAARRSYDDTLRLWDSRLSPGLAHWTEAGKIKLNKAEKLKNMRLGKQVKAVLKLEKKQIFFSKDFSKSILYSVAAPGSSQHLSLLAFDASEFDDARVRRILARHGWFRTVNSDLPHFTFLGRKECDLPAFGLKKVETKHGEFWIPNV